MSPASWLRATVLSLQAWLLAGRAGIALALLLLGAFAIAAADRPSPATDLTSLPPQQFQKVATIGQGLAHLALVPLPVPTPALLGASGCAGTSVRVAYEYVPLPGQTEPLEVVPSPPDRLSADEFSPLTMEQTYLGQAVGSFSLSPLPVPGRLETYLGSVRGVRQAYHRYLLNGALDNEVFHIESPFDPDDVYTQSRRDADARYYLIHLASQAKPQDLATEAISWPSPSRAYVALRQNPDKYRGQVVRLQGNLFRLGYFEVRRPVPGVPQLYQGWIALGNEKQIACVLFVELPPGLPPEPDWADLRRRPVPVQCDGYFLKIVKATDDQGKAYLCPTLVGRTIHVQESPAPVGVNWGQLMVGIVIVVAGGALVIALTLWLHRRSERRYAERIGALREQRADRRRQLADQPPAAGPTWEQPIPANGQDTSSPPLPNGTPDEE